MPYGGAAKLHSVTTMVAISLALLWSAGVPGCVPLFSAKKGDTPNTASNTAMKALIKAKTGSYSTSDPRQSKGGQGTSPAQRDYQPSKDLLPSAPLRSAARVTKANGNGEEALPVPKETARTLGPERRKDGDSIDEIFPVASDTAAAKHGKRTAQALPIASGKGDSRKPTFKKHDHAKYIKKVTDRAVKMVRKVGPSLYAALCRDTITDEWTLAMYTERRKKFVYTVHVWDGIDEKWHESFASRGRPLKSLKKHLKVLSTGKECRVLKNSLK